MSAPATLPTGAFRRAAPFRRISLLAALLFVVVSAANEIRQQPPQGSLRGKVVAAETGHPLAGVQITLSGSGHAADVDDDAEYRRVRSAVTGPDGAFVVPHILAGGYRIQASTRAHEGTELCSISEGAVTQTTLALKRSQKPLEVKEHQRVFSTRESPRLSITGYADEKKPRGSDSVRIRLYKTSLTSVLKDPVSADALQKVGAVFDGEPRLPAALIHPANAEAPTPVATRDLPILDDAEGFYYQKIDFAALKLGNVGAGLYLMSIDHKADSACAWVLITDTALVVKRAQNRVLGYAVDMTTGAPAGRCELRAYRRGRIVARQMTGDDGVGEFALPADQSVDPEGQRLTFAVVRGTDEAVVNRAYYHNERDEALAVHTYTDRPIYRPGQRIEFKSILREHTAPGASAPYTVPIGRDVTMELRDPAGDRVYESRLRTNRYGSVSGGVNIPADSPTGVYTFKLRSDGDEYTHDVVIASYRKPEFSVTVTPEQKRYLQGDTVKMTLSAQYYFGAPVVGATVNYFVYSSPDYTGRYGEDDEGAEADGDVVFGRQEYFGGSVAKGEATLDGSGKAVITFSTDNPKRPRRFRMPETFTVSATVKEGENRLVEAQGDVVVTPGAFQLLVDPDGYIGMPNKPLSVTVRAVDYDGRPVAGAAVDVETGYQQWAQGSPTFHRAALQHIVLDANGRTTLSATPARSGSFVIKVFAHDGQGREIVGRGDLWVTDDRGEDLDTTSGDLSLLTDRKRYRPGDTARVLVNSAHSGQTVLITIEGDRLYTRRTLPMDRKSKVIYVPILAEYGPNAYLSACCVRAKKLAQSSAALRVSMPQQELKVEVTPDRSGDNKALARYAPGDPVRYTVRTSDVSGRPVPAEISFGVVDESIYALKEDAPGALRDSFFPRQANRVNTDYSFAIEYLGDADKSEPKITARKKFPDTAYWNPSVLTDGRGTATVQLRLPDTLTTWRATATAHTLDTRLGRATCKVLCAKDFLVRLQAPRFLTQTDRAEVAAFVHNDTGKAQTALVHFTAENLTIEGSAEQTLHLNAGQIGQVKWNVAATGYGEARLTLKAWTPREGTAPQFTDGVEQSLGIRPHGRETVQAFAGQLTADRPEAEVLRMDSAAIPALSHATVRITPSVSTALVGATEYLIGFPYGCTEQTMSRFLPDLLVQRAMRRNGLSDVPNAAQIPAMVRAGLRRLYRFQHSDTGGWGWWEHDADDVWMTAYVLSGLATAKNEGYEVNPNVLKRAIGAASQMAGDARTDLSDRAFLIYALAQAGARSEALQHLQRKIPAEKLRTDGFAHMVLAARALGAPNSLLEEQLDRRISNSESRSYWKGAEDSWQWSDIGTTAVAMRALIAERPTDARIGRILGWLMAHRQGEYWNSTRDTSLVLAALCDFLATRPEYRPGGEVRVKVNGRLYHTFALTPELLREREAPLRIPGSSLRPDKNDIVLERSGGDSPIYYSIEIRQMVSGDTLPAVPSGVVEVRREYLRLASKPARNGIFTQQTEPTDNRLRGGDWIRVRLTITCKRDLEYVLLEDPFPAGCEPNERGDVDDNSDWSVWWSSVDVRDDRVAFFCRKISQGVHVIEYNLRPMTPGAYQALPTLAQAMYSPETRCETGEARVTVQ